jgi:hypothetical protein
MACADVATANANTTINNLIIASSYGDPLKERFLEGC